MAKITVGERVILRPSAHDSRYSGRTAEVVQITGSSRYPHYRVKVDGDENTAWDINPAFTRDEIEVIEGEPRAEVRANADDTHEKEEQ